MQFTTVISVLTAAMATTITALPAPAPAAQADTPYGTWYAVNCSPISGSSATPFSQIVNYSKQSAAAKGATPDITAKSISSFDKGKGFINWSSGGHQFQLSSGGTVNAGFTKKDGWIQDNDEGVYWACKPDSGALFSTKGKNGYSCSKVYTCVEKD